MNGEQQPITKEILTDILKKEVILPIGEKLDTMAGQIGALQSKVGGLETKVDGLDVKVGGLETKVDGLDVKVGGLETKVDGLDIKVGGLGNKVDDLYGKVSDLQNHELKQDIRMDKMESNLKQEITKFKDEILTSNDQLSKKMDKILAETASHTAAYKRHDIQLDDHDKRLKVLEFKPAQSI